MNIGEAIDVINVAIDFEETGRIQERLQAAVNSISNMASNPQDPSYQTALAANIEELRNVLNDAATRLSPAEMERLRLLGALNYFDSSLVNEIIDSVNANPSTPAVARDFMQEILNGRRSVLEDFRNTRDTAKRLRWAEDINHDKVAEVGFTIPRSIFDNRFDTFIKELDFLKRFVGSIYETLGEDSSDIEVSSLSTTDPLILLAVTYYVAKKVGQTVTWALESWKTVEEIRQLRSSASKVSSFTAEEIEKVFGNKIKEQITTEIAAEAKNLVADMGDGARKNELEGAFNIYLRQLLERIERGMTVEIRLIGGPQGGEELPAAEEAEFVALSDKLTFPTPSGQPVLALTDGCAEGEGGAAKPKAGPKTT